MVKPIKHTLAFIIHDALFAVSALAKTMLLGTLLGHNKTINPVLPKMGLLGVGIIPTFRS